MKFSVMSAIGFVGGIVFGILSLTQSGKLVLPQDSKRPGTNGAERQIQAFNPAAMSGDQLPPARPNVAEVVAGSGLATAPEMESNLRYKVQLLERGKKTLQGVTDYTATLQKQELIRGTLLAEQVLSIKCRNNPFSVYLLWLSGDEGREVIFVDGLNNGNLIAHDGGWKSRIPAISLHPEGSLAMRDTRYPVTEAGLLGLITVMIGIHQDDLSKSNFLSCEIDKHHQFDGRPCYLFTTKYKSAMESPIYRKSITLIDREWSVPVKSRQFEWPRNGAVFADGELDGGTLLESYAFTDVKLRCNLKDLDFDRTNQEYHFH